MNFEQIKSDIISKGLAYESAFDGTEKQLIIVQGEYRRDGSVVVTKTAAGFSLDGFGKTIPTAIEINSTIKDEMQQELESQFPGVKIQLQIL